MSGKFNWSIETLWQRGSAYSRCCVIALLFLVSGCDENKTTSSATSQLKPQVITVESATKTLPLLFNATLKPKSLVNVTSHVDGQIKQIFFSYGQPVAAGQRLLTLSSKKLAEDFEQALADYWQIKEELLINARQWRGTKELHRLGLIATQEYDLQRKQQHQKTFEFYQKKKRLEQLFYETSNEEDQLLALEELSFSAVAQAKQALQQPHNKQQLYAPVAGVVLFAEKAGKQGERPDTLVNGSPVKAEDILFAIGDLSGFSLDLQVSQLQIEKLSLGQTAIITSAAFPTIKLLGKIDALDSQATKGHTGMPVFNAHVTVQDVSTEQAAHLHVGMSVQVMVNVILPSQLWLPLAAVHSDEGKKWVTRLVSQGKQQQVAVVTGNTDLDSVAILQGLKAGDRIVIN